MHPQLKSCLFLLLVVLSVAACDDQKPKSFAGFEIHPDFQLELIASEPQIFDPVDLQFDEAGRAFVLEMPGYPLRDEESRLILLQDKDGDGRYDHRQVFADSLQLASSFMPYKGGMLVAAPPDLLYIKDTDDDGVADDYQVIMSGFSTGNLQHNFNGLTYGLDNWIYAANGGNSGEPYFAQDTTIRLNMRRNDIRFRIDDKKLESFGRSSGGFKLTPDQWGNLYETHNTEHVSHLVFPNRYLTDLPVSPQHALELISDHDEHNLSRIYPVGEQVSRVNHPEQSGYFSGACGITFYGGGAFPKSFNDNLFVADVVLNLLHLDVLSPDVASFKTSRMREKTEFLASTQRAFRPVNMTVGPDGALYVIDIHREVIEHPEWIPDELEVEMDLSAGKQQGRIYRITSTKNARQPLTTLNPQRLEDLVNALESKNQWVRMTAQRLLVEADNQEAIPFLETLYSNTENPLAQLHVLWTLDGLQALKNDLLLQALESNSAGLVENIVKMLENRLNANPALIAPVIALLESSHPRVRMQAALSLSTINTASFDQYANKISEACYNLLNTKEDQIDQWITWAVASAVKRNASSFTQDALRQKGEPTEALLNVLQILARVVGKERNTRDMAILLDLLRQHQDIDLIDQAAMIDGLTDGWKAGSQQGGTPKIITVLEALEAQGNRLIVHATGNLRVAMGLPISSKINQLLIAAKADALNSNLPTEERIACVQLVKLDQFNQREELLYKLLDNRQPLVLQKEALAQLRTSNQPEVGKKIVANWASLGPETRKGAGDILLGKPQYHDLLLTALEDGRIKVGELNFDLERRRRLLWWSDDDSIKKRAEALFSDAGVVTRKEAIEKMRPALQLAGNMVKGKEVFNTVCATCHQYGAIGVEVGPNLTEINRKSKETLFHEILDPNAAVDTRYLNHSVGTKDGTAYQGVVEQETDTELVLKMMGGQEVKIQKKDITEFTSLGLSLMPEGLEAGMSEQDMADLLAFLQGGAQEIQ